MGRERSNDAEVAYDALAPAYDDFTASYQAGSWTGKLAGLAEAQGLPGRRLLDVGCGTGKSTAPMLERGWEVVGCDISAGMLEVARERLGAGIELALADVRELPVFGEFDLVWAVNDTLNYVLDPAEFGDALVGMRRNLAPGGALVFDLNTLHSFRSGFAAEETREVGGRTMTWSGQTAPDVAPGSICEVRIEVGGGESSLHRQRHYPETEVVEAMGRSGLEFLGVWGELEGELSQPLDEGRHTKAAYLARPLP